MKALCYGSFEAGTSIEDSDVPGITHRHCNPRGSPYCILLPDRHTHHDIAPYAQYFNAAIGHRVLLLKRYQSNSIVDYQASSAFETHSILPLYCAAILPWSVLPKGECIVEARLALERGNMYYCEQLATASLERQISQWSVSLTKELSYWQATTFLSAPYKEDA